MPYRVAMGDIPALVCEAAQWLTPAQRAALRSPQRIAGRVLLSKAVCGGVLAEVHFSDCGKPGFSDASLPHFSLSHSGNNLLLLVSGQGEVGCDLEIVRPRPRWRQLAGQCFSDSCQRWLTCQPHPEEAFWQLWTLHEAILKQRGGSVWQMSGLRLEGPDIDPPGLFCRSMRVENSLLSLCGTQPFPVSLPIERY